MARIIEDAYMPEAVIEPDLPIVDPHHHLWLETAGSLADRDPVADPYSYMRLTAPRYLFEELHADCADGHRIVATVYAQCGSMYRASGPPEMASVGEVEFANGVAAMFASGRFGETRACEGIVGFADLTRGAAVEDTLIAMIAAGGGRFRGIRQVSAFDPGISLFANAQPDILADPDFRAGLRRLGELGLSFDAWMLEPQIPDLIALAKAVPEVPIVLNHMGTPLGIGPYAGRQGEVARRWRANIRLLAECPNVSVKLGGLGMPVCGFPSYRQEPRASSAQLAEEWRPYVETCIEAFGVGRCMFESNYPTDGGSADYRTLWNTFKRIAAGASADEKAALFAETAIAFYRLSPVAPAELGER